MFAYELINKDVAGFDVTPRGSVKLDKSRMSATCVFTTDSIDRVGDRIDIPGIYTENHRRNPVVLWDHGKTLTLPIGKTVSPEGRYTITLGADYAEETTYFSQSLQEAEQIYWLIDEGIISANSIGFRPLKAAPLFQGGRRRGMDLKEVELLEISWVAIPCNQDAVRHALDLDRICGKALSPTLRAALEPSATRRKAWSNGWTPGERTVVNIAAKILSRSKNWNSKSYEMLNRRSDARILETLFRHDLL